MTSVTNRVQELEIEPRLGRVRDQRVSVLPLVAETSLASTERWGLSVGRGSQQDRGSLSSSPSLSTTRMRPTPDRANHTASNDERGDEELMLAFRDGEAAAFEQLVVRHRRPLFNFLLRSVHNKARAEELLQEVFLRVVRAKERYQRTAKFTTWVYTIARNLCVDESRRQKFRRTQSLEQRRGRDGGGLSILDQSAAQQPGVDQLAQGPTLRERMQEAVSRLPDEQREVFLMRQISGLSFKEIGAAVGAPENTVKSRMRYALEKLRGELADVDPRASADADDQKRKGANG